MTIRHRYETTTTWTGNRGEGTAGYRAYDRAHESSAPDRPAIASSADPAFRGDPQRWNPELLLVAALSQCHMLCYLAQCAMNGVVVTGYVDVAAGTMAQNPDGSGSVSGDRARPAAGGRFEEVILRPVVTVASDDMVENARGLHRRASELCFIASSVNFPVRHEPDIRVGPSEPSLAG